MSLGFCSNS